MNFTQRGLDCRAELETLRSGRRFSTRSFGPTAIDQGWRASGSIRATVHGGRASRSCGRTVRIR